MVANKERKKLPDEEVKIEVGDKGCADYGRHINLLCKS